MVDLLVDEGEDLEEGVEDGVDEGGIYSCEQDGWVQGIDLPRDYQGVVDDCL